MKGLRFIAEHRLLSLLMAAVIVVVFIGAPIYGVASGRVDLSGLGNSIKAEADQPIHYEGQDATLASHLQGPVGLLVSAPVVGCPSVQQAGLHTQDVPEAENFAYATSAYGGSCAAVLFAHGKDVEISSSKPTMWAAQFDVQTDGQHMSYGLVFSYGTSLTVDNELATSPNGASYHAVPVELYVFSLPDTDPVSLDTAEAALPMTFTGQSGPYYPVIETAGGYGLIQQAKILDAIIQAPPMK